MEDSVIYSEVYEILNILGDAYISKIPPELYMYIENKRDKNYDKKFDRHKSIEDQGYMDKTIEFISFLNLDYWTSENEKAELMKVYAENDKMYEEELQKRYIPNGLQNLFGQAKVPTTNEIDYINDKAIVSVDENSSVLRKIANFFKKIFGHKH